MTTESKETGDNLSNPIVSVPGAAFEVPVTQDNNIDINTPLPEVPVLTRLVPPHTKKSRPVREEDLPRVVVDAKTLHEICFQPIGNFKGAYAMHHSQIDDRNPLNFFVTFDRKIIINPTITRHSNYFADSKEGCMSFPTEETVIVPRWQKMDVEYVTVMSDPDKEEGHFKLSDVVKESVSGRMSFVYQHEMDHGEAKFIYPIPVIVAESDLKELLKKDGGENNL